ncbi:MAG TPA: Rne/Rng family ribonuclease [Terracidiphilus sp.]
MAKEICISSTPHETRLAILEDDQLAEIYYERENEYTLAGSIYNGRVTRVLPGMQSAFVDVGLERDAFLYVTDFLELEDSEEADELEKAAATGVTQPPREVRHANGPDRSDQNARKDGRTEERGDDRGQRAAQRPDQKQQPGPERPTPDRQPRGRRFVVEPEPEAGDAAASDSSFIAGPADSAQDESAEPGAKRWRGRRRRRGGRGPAASPESRAETGESTESDRESPAESAVAQVIQASAGVSSDAPPRGFPAPTSSQGWNAPASAPRAGQAPVPFVLPGESLSKYGGAPEDEAPQAEPASSRAAQARPASTFKPASLIESPLAWDGSGLLPGESISRHRKSQPQPSAEGHPELQGVFSNAVQFTGTAPDAIEEQDFFAERTESAAEQSAAAFPQGLVPEVSEDHLVAEDQFEESTETAAHTQAEQPEPAAPDAQEYEVEEVIEQPSADEPLADPVVRQDEVTADLGSDQPPVVTEPLEPESPEPYPQESESEEPKPEEPEADSSASHHVDPAHPSGFRLFGLGGKKKTEEPAPAPAPPAPKPTTVTTVSAYAPGAGLIEEEVIDDEEFDAAPHHHGKAEEHDLEDYEEETLPTQIRSGDLGELLQEAHLDHRIQLNFDEKGGDDEAFDDEDDEEEEEPAAEGQPASGQPQDSGQQRRDRGRGRRGRGGQPQPGQGNRRGGSSRRSMQTSDLPIISDLLKPGQEILVQIAKEPIAKKGARITSHIALPGRFLVFMPTVSHIGVSRKIAADEERQRLKRILVSERGDASGGFIVRTAAEGASEEDLRADLRFLIHLWSEIKLRSDSSKSPALIYHDLSLIERILRDQVSANFSSIWVDSEADYERIVRFLNRFSPTLVRRVKLYTKETPLFEHFGIQDEISKALRSKVWLKSGGSIVINQTEALVAIDINTGKYVGKSARLEDTIVKTNLDAVPEIVRQIRLRDLGGIIVIDFIDMDDRKNRYKVMAALEEALKSDRAPTKVLQFNDFGLVAITRKRVKQSLERTLSVPCPTCQATGMVKSPTTVCNEIYTELRKMRKHFEGADVLLRVNPETVKVLKGNGSWLTEFEELVGKNILVKSDPTLHPEQFDIQG